MQSRVGLSERAIVFLVGAVQFVNVLDFMMVMPLGPDFAEALGIPTSELGLIGGSYTLAAAVAGIVASTFLDRFDRRPALAVAMIGLVCGTAAGGLATDLPTLMAARVVAGLFGGPATSLSLSIIADAIPPERRGRAMGGVMSAFAVASVLGVPAGLELARRGGWRLPFFAVAALGFVVALAAVALLPPLRIHLEAAARGERRASFGSLLVRPTVLVSLAMTAVIMASVFVVVPNISAYFQFNLGLPRERLGALYLEGGLCNFVALPLVGRLVDRTSSTTVGAIGTAILVASVYLGFVAPDRDHLPPALPIDAIFVLFMLSSSFRSVPYNALTSKVPAPDERARFMSLQSAVQHAAAAAGAFLSARLLVERADHGLQGMPAVGLVSNGLSLTVPLFLFVVERRVRGGPRSCEGERG